MTGGLDLFVGTLAERVGDHRVHFSVCHEEWGLLVRLQGVGRDRVGHGQVRRKRDDSPEFMLIEQAAVKRDGAALGESSEYDS